jgi:hypothetical protein
MTHGAVIAREYGLPAVVGWSTPPGGSARGSGVSPNGLIVGHYERDGEVKIGDSMLDSPSEREIARQERMKREG